MYLEKLERAGKRFTAYCLSESLAHPIEYEPRSSLSCNQCNTIWVGTKAGKVHRISGLPGRISAKKVFGHNAGIRALAHSCDDDSSLLLVGTDAGTVHELTESDPQTIWSFTTGVTALVIHDVGSNTAQETASVALQDGTVWNLNLADWTLSTTPVVVVGDWVVSLHIAAQRLIVTTRAGLVEAHPLRTCDETVPCYRTRLGGVALGAALAPATSNEIAIGSSSGVHRINLGVPNQASSAPDTIFSRTLSVSYFEILDRESRPKRRYLAAGLADGRLVLTQLETSDATAHASRTISKTFGAPIVVLETLCGAQPQIVLGLQDHRIIVLSVHDYEKNLITARSALKLAERELFPEEGPTPSPKDMCKALQKREKSCHSSILAAYITCQLAVDTPDRCSLRAVQEAIDECGEKIPIPILLAATQHIGSWSKNCEVSDLVKLATTIAGRMSRRDPVQWNRFVHIVYHALLEASLANRPGGTNCAELIMAARMTRKYLLLEHVFVEKMIGLNSLVETNERIGKPLDALIYLAELYHRRHDFMWREEVSFEAAFVTKVSWREHNTEVVLRVSRSGRWQLYDLRPDGPVRVAGQDYSIAAAEGAKVKQVLAHALPPEEPPLPSQSSKRPGKFGIWFLAVLGTPSATDAIKDQLRVLELEYDSRTTRVTVKKHRIHRSERPVQAVAGSSSLPRSAFTAEAGSLYRFRDDGSRVDLGAPESWARGSRVPDTSTLTCKALKDGRFLIAQGFADGQICVARVKIGAQKHHSQRPPLGRDTESDRPDLVEWTSLAHVTARVSALSFMPNGSNWWCHVGTVAGGLSAYSVRTDAARIALASNPTWFDMQTAEVRSLHEMPNAGFLGVQKSSALVCLGRDGRVAFYEPESGRSRTTTADGHYRFCGTRYDRLSLGPDVVALALTDVQQSNGFIIETSKHLSYGKFRYLRNGHERTEMWRQLYKYYLAVTTPSKVRRYVDVDTLRLLHTSTGSLRRYLVHIWLEPQRLVDRWPESRFRAERVLSGLQPDSEDERAETHTILTAIGRTRISRLSAQMRRHFEPTEDLVPIIEPTNWAPSAEDALEAAEFLLKVGEELASRAHEKASGRLRIVVFRELISIRLLEALNIESAGAVRIQLSNWLQACLGSGSQIVRVESLRIFAMVLRDISVLLAFAPEAEASTYRESLFPGGVIGTTGKWLLDALLPQLGRIQRFASTPPTPTGWYLVGAVAALIRVFHSEVFYILRRISEEHVDESMWDLLSIRLANMNEAALVDKLKFYRFPLGDLPDSHVQFTKRDFSIDILEKNLSRMDSSRTYSHSFKYGDRSFITQYRNLYEKWIVLLAQESTTDLKISLASRALALPENCDLLPDRYLAMRHVVSEGLKLVSESPTPPELCVPQASEPYLEPDISLIVTLFSLWRSIGGTDYVPPKQGPHFANSTHSTIHKTDNPGRVTKRFAPESGTEDAIARTRACFVNGMEIPLKVLPWCNNMIGAFARGGNALFPVFTVERVDTSAEEWLRKVSTFPPREKAEDFVAFVEQTLFVVGLLRDRGISHQNLQLREIFVKPGSGRGGQCIKLAGFDNATIQDCVPQTNSVTELLRKAWSIVDLSEGIDQLEANSHVRSTAETIAAALDDRAAGLPPAEELYTSWFGCAERDRKLHLVEGTSEDDYSLLMDHVIEGWPPRQVASNISWPADALVTAIDASARASHPETTLREMACATVFSKHLVASLDYLSKVTKITQVNIIESEPRPWGLVVFGRKGALLGENWALGHQLPVAGRESLGNSATPQPPLKLKRVLVVCLDDFGHTFQDTVERSYSAKLFEPSQIAIYNPKNQAECEEVLGNIGKDGEPPEVLHIVGHFADRALCSQEREIRVESELLARLLKDSKFDSRGVVVVSGCNTVGSGSLPAGLRGFAGIAGSEQGCGLVTIAPIGAKAAVLTICDILARLGKTIAGTRLSEALRQACKAESKPGSFLHPLAYLAFEAHSARFSIGS